MFRLKNSMEYPISQLSVSPTQLNMWGPNFLRPPAISRPGEARGYYRAPTRLVLGRPEGLRSLMAVRRRSGGYLNLCTLKNISLYYDRMSGITTARYDE